MSENNRPKNVDEYIKLAPDHAREKLIEIRLLLKSVAPNATEEIKWGKPVLIEKRILFSFAAFKNHVTFMPTGPSLEPFKDELSTLKGGKDTIQFSYNEPLPKVLIEKIARYRHQDVIENDAKWMY